MNLLLTESHKNIIMKKSLILIIVFSMFYTLSFAQNKSKAEEIVEEGIAYHDKGEYAKAIKKYDEALKLDKDNLLALYEKSYSQLLLKKYDETTATCKKAIETHPNDEKLIMIYVNYGTAYDYLGKPEKAIEIYNGGIERFPDNYLLHFNKGISLINIQEIDTAIECFEKALVLNPNHAGSHNALGRMMEYKKYKIPAVLAFARLLALENNTGRAKTDLEKLQKLMKGNAEKTGRKSVTIGIDLSSAADTTADGKPTPNNFGIVDMILSMSSALDYDRKYKKETDVERFIRKFELVCSSLDKDEKNSGFFWDFYAPYFFEMGEKDMIKTFGYIIFAESGDQKVTKWLSANEDKVEEFNKWSENFIWQVE